MNYILEEIVKTIKEYPGNSTEVTYTDKPKGDVEGLNELCFTLLHVDGAVKTPVYKTYFCFDVEMDKEKVEARFALRVLRDITNSGLTYYTKLILEKGIVLK